MVNEGKGDDYRGSDQARRACRAMMDSVIEKAQIAFGATVFYETREDVDWRRVIDAHARREGRTF